MHLRFQHLIRIALFVLMSCNGCGGEAKTEALVSVNDLIRKLSSSDMNVQISAAEQLGQMGTHAEKAVPYLAKALVAKHQDMRDTSARSLGLIGPVAWSAKPDLIRSLRRYDAYEFPSVGEALLQIGLTDSESRTMESTLLKALSHGKREWVRAKAAHFLGRLGSKSEGATEGLLKALNDPGDPRYDIRREAIQALGMCRTTDVVLKRAVFLYDNNKRVAIAASIAIAKLTGKSPNLEELKEWWKSNGGINLGKRSNSVYTGAILCTRTSSLGSS